MISFFAEEFLEALKIEKEHGRINPKTNVIDDNLINTVKIALVYLNEFPNYYNLEYGLKTFEEFFKNKLKCN